MNVAEVVREFNIELGYGYESRDGIDGSNYHDRLVEVESAFDEFVESRKTTSKGGRFEPVTFAAVDVGRHMLAGATCLVVAQPATALTYVRRDGVERRERALDLFALEPGEKLETRKYFRHYNRRIGGSKIDSGRRKAIPSSMGLLEHFSEQLEEVIAFSR